MTTPFRSTFCCSASSILSDWSLVSSCLSLEFWLTCWGRSLFHGWNFHLFTQESIINKWSWGWHAWIDSSHQCASSCRFYPSRRAGLLELHSAPQPTWAMLFDGFFSPWDCSNWRSSRGWNQWKIWIKAFTPKSNLFERSTGSWSKFDRYNADLKVMTKRERKLLLPASRFNGGYLLFTSAKL